MSRNDKLFGGSKRTNGVVDKPSRPGAKQGRYKEPKIHIWRDPETGEIFKKITKQAVPSKIETQVLNMVQKGISKRTISTTVGISVDGIERIIKQYERKIKYND